MISKRSILLWYVLAFFTAGILGIVWYYLINRDAKTLAANKTWSPAISVLAVTFGALLIVPVYVSNWKAWGRVHTATGADGMSNGIQFCLVFIPIVNIAYLGYLQSKLNGGVPEAASAVAVVTA